MKFADVLIMLTRTVDDASVRARVKSPHIMPLKTRLRTKKNWWRGSCEYLGFSIALRGKDDWGHGGVHTPLTRYSMNLFGSARPNRWDSPSAHEVVSVVVVLRSELVEGSPWGLTW